MGAKGTHFVVHAFRQASRLTFDVIEGIWMRQHAHLPGSLGRPGKDGGLLLYRSGIEGAGLGRLIQMLPLPQDNPTLRDGISSNFHAEFFRGDDAAMWKYFGD
jgi:hypothetical protein